MTNGRKSCRSGHPCEPRSLGEAIYCSTFHSEAEARTIAERMGVRYSYLADAANPDRDGQQFQARLLVPLMHATGNLAPLAWLARAMGGVFVRTPDVAVEHDDVRRAFLAATREIGEDAGDIERALADGVITGEEARQLEVQIDETIAELVSLKATIRKKAGVPPLQAVVGGERRR